MALGGAARTLPHRRRHRGAASSSGTTLEAAVCYLVVNQAIYLSILVRLRGLRAKRDY